MCFIKAHRESDRAPKRELYSSRTDLRLCLRLMLSPKTQYNLKNAKEYFEEHLCIGDYYSEGEHISGKWIGKGAERLGLHGQAGRDEFLRLCENLHPQSGELLTQRKKTTRLMLDEEGNDVESANRRVFYDFTISPPKDVSILALLGGDHRIVAAHDQAVQSAVSELEQFAATRVRRAGGSTDRGTGNIVGAVFQHDTSRSLDPHLHSHCIFFNATYDVVEDRWKALQNYEMLRAQKFVENVYYHELARALGQCGYQVENRTCGDFVIRGVSDELRNTFSKRHAEIDQKTRDLLAREPEMAAGNVADIREHIAHNERSRKIRDITGETLSELWKGQLTKSEGLAVANLVADAQKARRALKQASADGSLAWAEDHLFERKSVVREHELWRYALEHARGCELDVSALKQESARRPYIRDLDDPCKVTTRETMGREWDVLQLAKSGIGKCEPLNADRSGARRRPAQSRSLDSELARFPHPVPRWSGNGQELRFAGSMAGIANRWPFHLRDRAPTPTGDFLGAGWPRRSSNRQ
jgi:conjugative relaxase-like TrwC/TraI family protein